MPARPRSWEHVGFEPRDFVRWFHPGELLRAGLSAMLGSLFGSFVDKREIQAALNSIDDARFRQYANAAPNDDFWFDFVADIGDGFKATYSIAYLLAQERLTIPGQAPMPRGQILIMGGDEVYPVASRKRYLDRTVGPYRAALPYIEDEARVPHLYAIPGNHDWYDGLSAFLRQFAQYDQRWVGAWLTQQRRSYFARQLPRSYWLWGVDIQLHADIDSPQLGYFHEAAQRLQPGDRVILATAEPSWVKEAEGDHAGYQSLLRLMGDVTRRGARVVAIVTGDSHHYAHYVDAVTDGNETHFITAGGGGAFLHGTHTLPPTIALPKSTDSAAPEQPRLLQLQEAFPTASESRQIIRTKIASFPLTNRAFALAWVVLWLWLGLLLWTGDVARARGADRHIIDQLSNTLTFAALEPRVPWLVTLAAVFSAGLLLRVLAGAAREERRAPRQEPGSTETKRNAAVIWRTVVDVGLWLIVVLALGVVLTAHVSPSAGPSVAATPSPLGVLWDGLSYNLSAALLVVLVPTASALFVSRPITWGAPWLGRFTLGLLHGSLYVLSWLLVASRIAAASAGHVWGAALWLVATPLVSGAISIFLFAGSLWFGGQYQRALLNDAFSAIGVEDFKNFLRMKISAAGELTIYAIGLERVVRYWDVDTQTTDAGAPHVIPAPGQKLSPHLIERIVIAAPAPARTPHPSSEA